MPDDDTPPTSEDLVRLADAQRVSNAAAVASVMPQRDRFTTQFVVVVAGVSFLAMIGCVCILALQQKPILQDLKELVIAVFAFLSGSLATLAVPKKEG